MDKFAKRKTVTGREIERSERGREDTMLSKLDDGDTVITAAVPPSMRCCCSAFAHVLRLHRNKGREDRLAVTERLGEKGSEGRVRV